MSKTDKTAPFWVKLKRHDLKTVAEHDHRDGVCNLPDEPGEVLYGPGHEHDCRWEFAYTGIHICCCAMCHGDWWGVPPGRRQRLEGKKACRDWQRDY
jgi:hypothetical protein